MPQVLPQTEITPNEALEILESYTRHPDDFYSEVLGTKPWQMQIDVLNAVFKHREVAVKSCHGTGKSFNAARIALAFLTTHPGSIVVTTAPTWRQVKDVLWRELATAYNSSRFELGGALTKVGLEYDDDWYAIGLSTTDPDKFQGYHSDHVLVIVDEAAGVEEPIFEGVRAITSNENAHVLYIGNPTTVAGSFFKAFRNPRVKQFTISAFDTPNFKANKIFDLDDLIKTFSPPPEVSPLDYRPELNLPYPALISPTWVYERYLEWGTDSPMWQARVMGEFPSQADSTLIPLNMIEASMDKEYRDEHGWKVMDGEMAYGVDVARFGSDRTVIFPVHGGFVEDPIVIRKQDTQAVATRILDTLDHSVWHTPLRIDDTGLGGGVTDALNKAKRDHPDAYHYRVVPVNFGEMADETRIDRQLQALNRSSAPRTEKIPRFYNKRAEMYWNLRELIINKQVALPQNEALANELASIRYEYTAKQQIKIEDKAEIKKRTTESPDLADALALAFIKGAAAYSDIKGTPKTERTERGTGERKPYVKPITSGFFGKRF